MNPRTITFLAAGLLVSSACDDATNNVKEPGTSTSSSSSSSGDIQPDAGEKDCFDNPQTHFEIINGCTTADRIDRRPTLTKLLQDGGLPPLE